jgi:hypothetical protein
MQEGVVTVMSRKIDELLDASGLLLLQQAVKEIVDDIFPEIVGVLAVGSLIHQEMVPGDLFIPQARTARGLAYESIRNPARRRSEVNEESDLDIWICVQDTEESARAQEPVENAAVALLDELVSGTMVWGTPRWHNKKKAILGPYYKQRSFYPKQFVDRNGDDEPWLAARFKTMIEERIQILLPDFVDKVNSLFAKRLPGDFLEVRAFPESLFHLRPDDTLMSNMMWDRMPFPRIADAQWISPEHSSLILYRGASVGIYPFREDGRLLGEKLAQCLLVSQALQECQSFGSLVLKPDAIRKKQVEIIMQKIHAALITFGGRIVARSLISPVSEIHVETMYPLLQGRELQEAKAYLVGGEMIVMIITANLSASDLFRKISDIKGPRLIDRTYERLIEGRIMHGSLRDLLPVPGEEDAYRSVLPKIFAKQADPSIRFTDDEYEFYAQNLVHSPDNQKELEGTFQLVGFIPE